MATVLNHPVLSFGAVDKSSLLPAKTDAEIDAEIAAEVRRDWKNDRKAQVLAKLAYALGVGKIILADIDTDDRGEYIYARDREWREKLKPWKLSPRQLAAADSALCRGRDVVLLSYQSCGDLAATLAHEIGHYINRRLGGLHSSELSFAQSFPVTENMRRVARYVEYFYQNRDEYYAETWARYLCGDKNRALFDYLKKPLRRLRMEHPEKTRLIEDHRARVCDR
jgi:hypothetical protein